MKYTISGPVDLNGKVALVTGAARGIGQAVCRALAREGADVALCDVIDTAATARLVLDNGTRALEIMCDVRSRHQVQEAVKRVMERFERIDILVGSAGILGDSRKPIEEIPLSDWDEVLNVNLRGQFLMTQAVWPHLSAGGGGKIVLIGSIAGRLGGLIAGPHYCASKGGIHTFVKWAAKKGAPLGIFVNGVAPGPISTPMVAGVPFDADVVPLKRVGQPEDIAEPVVFLVSQSSNFITGNVLDVNGGMFMV